MNFAADVGSLLRSGYALPTQRPNIGIQCNRQEIHLSKAKRCFGEADHLSICSLSGKHLNHSGRWIIGGSADDG